MVNEHNADLMIRNLGFSHYESILTENHCGGIWCLWNPVNIYVTIITKENRVIHCDVVDNTNSKRFVLRTIYAPAQN